MASLIAGHGLEGAVLQDNGDHAARITVDRMAALGPDVGKANRLQSADDFPPGQVGARGSYRGGPPLRRWTRQR
jgi:hypothetical protein